MFTHQLHLAFVLWGHLTLYICLRLVIEAIDDAMLRRKSRREGG